jgi:hypothetical protein
MSTTKNPQDKKRQSLNRDRRNVYGENAKASRKNIPRSKQLTHMDERRAVTALLNRLKGAVDEDDASAAESNAKAATTDSRRRGFKKKPDAPLGAVLAKKLPR